MSLAAGLLDCGILRGRISCLPLVPGKSQKGVAVGGDYRKPEGQQLRPLIPCSSGSTHCPRDLPLQNDLNLYIVLWLTVPREGPCPHGL